MKTVTVLLTKYSDWISSLVFWVGGHGYTHASLSLEEDRDTYYSFNYRGFCTETPEKHRRRGVEQSIGYELAVSDEAYQSLQAQLAQFRAQRASLRYTRLGVLFCLLRIPFRWKNHYFCSQFVAQLLQTAGAVPLSRPASLYLPNHFGRDLPCCGQLLRVCPDPV